jgi:hypothetical protein
LFRFSTHTGGRRNSNLLCDSRERRSLRPDRDDSGRYSRKPGFTETRLRPLARRRERTFWPPWVFMRVRNPCFFDRLRRLGWNVRLGIEKYLLLIRSAVLGQTESINQPSHSRQTRDRPIALSHSALAAREWKWTWGLLGQPVTLITQTISIFGRVASVDRQAWMVRTKPVRGYFPAHPGAAVSQLPSQWLRRGPC